MLQLWKFLENTTDYKDFKNYVKIHLKEKVEEISSVSQLTEFLWTLSSYKYFEIYTWDAAFRLLIQLNNKGEEELSIIQRYKLLDLWCRLMNKIVHPSFYRLYSDVVDIIFKGFFKNFNGVHFQSYIKSSPGSLQEITSCFSNYYDIIEEL